MGAVALFSGGKDSTRAVQLALEAGIDVDCLLTARSARHDSYMFHSRALELVELQAEAMGIPVRFFETSGVKEEELGPLREVIKELKEKKGIRTIIAGALRSNYQLSRVESLAKDLDMEIFTPLWHLKAEEHLRALLAHGYDILMVAVAAEGLDATWLGRRVDEKAVAELVRLSERYGLNVDGEGGEYETSVLNAPFFKKRVRIDRMTAHWEGSAGHIEIEKAGLI